MPRLSLFPALILAGSALLFGAAPPKLAPAVDDPAVRMSPFEVQANSVEFRRWIKVGSPHFIVYTDGGASEASQTLRELEMLHAATEVFFGRRALKFPPVTVILPTASSDWRQLETKGQVEWKTAVDDSGEELAELIVVQYDWQDQGIWIVRAAQASCEAARMNLHGPFWFQRGLHSFFETAEFEKATVRLGRTNPRSWHLQHAKWLPWDRFFSVDENSPEFVKEKLISQYEAQATIFTHFLFTNPDRAWVSRWTSWIEYLNAGHPPAEAPFKAIFTQDWKTWQRTMENYMEGGQYNIYNVPIPPETTRYTETKFKLPVTEMRELFILAQTLVQKVPASEVSLDALLAKGLKTESLREFLVSSCLRWNRVDAALENLRQMITAGSINPRDYTLAAKLLTSWRAREPSLRARLGDEVSQVRAWCQRALEIEPYFPEANSRLAWAEAMAPQVDAQGIATIEKLYASVRGRLPPDDIIMALAVALWRAGDVTTARELSVQLEAAPLGTKQSRELASRLLEQIGSK